MYLVLFYGDRNWNDRKVIRMQLVRLRQKHGVTDLVIMEGGARGADTISKQEANKLDIHVAEIKALWDTRMHGAGPQRNFVMRGFEPDEAIGFHDDIENSKGSKHMKELLEEWGITNKIIRSANARR